VSALGLPNDTLTRDSISVGQRIVAFGELADDRTLDATESHVRMQLSDLTADVVVSNPLALDLYFQNGRRPVVYDYSGTGVDPAHDADPEFTWCVCADMSAAGCLPRPTSWRGP
jgi:hypothetical protein